MLRGKGQDQLIEGWGFPPGDSSRHDEHRTDAGRTCAPLPVHEEPHPREGRHAELGWVER